MNKTFWFGFLELFLSTGYFCIFGFARARKSILRAYTGLRFYALATGFWDLFQGIYYISPSIDMAKAMLSMVYAILPFAMVAFLYFVNELVYPWKRINKILEVWLFVIPIITAILSLTSVFHNFFITYGDNFYFDPFREIEEDFHWGSHISFIYNKIIIIISLAILIINIKSFFKKSKEDGLLIWSLIILNILLYFFIMIFNFEVLYWSGLIIKLVDILMIFIILLRNENEKLIYQGQRELLDLFQFPVIFKNNKNKIVYANSKATESFPCIRNFYKEDSDYNDFFDYFTTFNFNKITNENKFSNNVRNLIQNKETGEYYFIYDKDIYNKKNNKYRGKMEMLLTISSIKDFLSGLETMAFKDNLTGFYNRYYLDILKNNIENKDDVYPVSLMMCDLDNLKKVNDNLGHEVGDEYILLCASVLKQFTRKSDYIFRLGGDEFLILLQETSSNSSVLIAEKIMENMNNRIFHDYKIGISIGCASVDAGPFNFDELLKVADSEMYVIKQIHKKNNRMSVSEVRT